MNLSNDDLSNYIPLNLNTISSGQKFGPHEYSISEQSHKHHIEYLNKGNYGLFFQFDQDFLFPYELFPLPRVLSITGGYKKINEIISVYCERRINYLPKPSTKLMAFVSVDEIIVSNGIAYGIFTSKTYTTDNKLLMTSLDKLILLNISDKQKIHEIIQLKHQSPVTFNSINSSILVNNFELFFRFNWDERIWNNNIHIDSYAQSLGYKRGIIEAPCLIDILLTNIHTGELLRGPLAFNWEYYSPLYYGINIDVFFQQGTTQSEIVVCDALTRQMFLKLNVSKQ